MSLQLGQPWREAPILSAAKPEPLPQLPQDTASIPFLLEQETAEGQDENTLEDLSSPQLVYPGHGET